MTFTRLLCSCIQYYYYFIFMLTDYIFMWFHGLCGLFLYTFSFSVLMIVDEDIFDLKIG